MSRVSSATSPVSASRSRRSLVLSLTTLLAACLLAAAPACTYDASVPGGTPDAIVFPDGATGADGITVVPGPDAVPGSDGVGPGPDAPPSGPDGGPAGDVPPGVDQPPPADLPPTSNVTTLRVHYPAGSRSLSVRGSGGPLNWDQGLSMTSAGNDTWVYTSDALSEPLEWKPLLDDADWSKGPNYVVQPGQTVDIYPHFIADSGQLVVLEQSFNSAYLDDNRPITAYLPPSYEENTTATYPVVYMHDGQNLFDPEQAFGGEWQVDEAVNGGAADGSIAEAIIIGVGNTGARIYEYTPTSAPGYSSGGGDDYLALLVNELKPLVDQRLRTRPGRESTAMIGSSLGGLISSYAGTTSASTFGLVGAMSPSTWWDDQVLLDLVGGSSGAAGSHPLRVYVDSGNAGDSGDGAAATAQLAEAYRDLGYRDGVDLLYVLQDGGQHNEYFWAQRIPGALQFLLGPREDLR